MRVALWICLATGCAHDVSQDARTGRDGRIGGARPITLDHDEGKVRGIVTYPGGDRVDWKSITLPATARGKLDLELHWKAPRPGLQVAFDVFDEWHQPVATAKRGSKHTRSASIANATGTYFVRVYAPRRGDAGEYVLAAKFAPTPREVEPDPSQIPDPPRLPAVTVDEPAPPPPPPVTPPPPQQQPPAPLPPPPPPTAQPVLARVISVNVRSSGVIFAVTAGSNRGVKSDWRVEILQGNTNAPLAGAKATIQRVTEEMTYVRANVSVDQINTNFRVRLSPP
jgi:hypothetical protein